MVVKEMIAADGSRFARPDAVWTWVDAPVRRWHVPEGNCVAYPSREFYTRRYLWFTNEGHTAAPRWVPLDRYNDADWKAKRKTEEPLTGDEYQDWLKSGEIRMLFRKPIMRAAPNALLRAPDYDNLLWWAGALCMAGSIAAGIWFAAYCLITVGGR